jgi:SAM-dependent methyltransferase
MTVIPSFALSLLRCAADGGPLTLARDQGERLRCDACGASYPVRDGFVDMLGDAPIEDAESRFEHEARAVEANQSRGAPGVPLSVVDELEVASTLRHLGDLAGCTVLELGCGAGLYTRLLAAQGARVVAVDFSAPHLAVHAAQGLDAERVALIRADVTTLRLAPSGIDLALNTLYSNLPSPTLRAATNALVVSALRPAGRYLVSAHHHDLRRRVRRRAPESRYGGSGIFYAAMTSRELANDLSAFSAVETTPAAVCLPFVMRWASDRVWRWLERVPGLNELGAILLADARKGA